LRVAVVIPARDEEATITAVLASLPRDWRAYVVDNGSRDRTGTLARAAGATVVREDRPGYGGACQAGIRRVEADGGCDVVLILDADGADDPSVFFEIVGPVERGEADLVLSTRTRGGALPGSLTFVQRVGNRVQVAVLNRRFGLRLTDMGPLRAIRWNPLRSLGMEDPNWGWNVEMVARAARARLRIVEVPVPYRPRQGGESKISGSVRGAARASVRIVQALWRYAR
jgi:glycosyltransferase involved in cell wall biosynthesis